MFEKLEKGESLCLIIFQQGSWKRRVRSDADTDADTDTDIFKKDFYIYISYFSYLTLFLQQSSPPDPGVDLFIALIHL